MGSHQCSCRDGFVLGADGVSCTSKLPMNDLCFFLVNAVPVSIAVSVLKCMSVKNCCMMYVHITCVPKWHCGEVQVLHEGVEFSKPQMRQHECNILPYLPTKAHK